MEPSSVRTVIGEYYDRTTIEEVCQILGHDPDQVITLEVDYNHVKVIEVERIDGKPLTYVSYRHVVR